MTGDDALRDGRAEAVGFELRDGGVEDGLRGAVGADEFDCVAGSEARNQMQRQPVKQRFLGGCWGGHEQPED